MTKLRILFVHDHLFLGGAAKAALRMRSAYRDLGHETLSIHGDKAQLPEQASKIINGKAGLWDRLLEIPIGKARQNQRRQVQAKNRLEQFLKRNPQDLIWFQNIAGAEKWGWSLDWIREAVNHAPVIITMHDMFYLGVKESYVWDRPVEPTRFAGLELKESSRICIWPPGRSMDWRLQWRGREASSARAGRQGCGSSPRATKTESIARLFNTLCLPGIPSW
jgi:hypothetical protein